MGAWVVVVLVVFGRSLGRLCIYSPPPVARTVPTAFYHIYIYILIFIVSHTSMWWRIV